MRQISIISGFVLILAGFVWMEAVYDLSAYEWYSHRMKNEMDNISVSSGGYDQPDRFFLFDAMKRKNPFTGKVPQDGIHKAYAEIEKQFSTLKIGNAIDWEERGPSDVGGRSRAIMWDPNDSQNKAVFAGGVGGGLWKTDDIFAASPVWTNLTTLYSNIAVTCVAFDPSNTQVMYFGTGEGWSNADAQVGAGVWKSTDGGFTWSQLQATANPDFNFIQKVAVNQLGHLFIGSKTGLYKSTDQGLTLTKVMGTGTGSGSDIVTDLEIASNGDLWVGSRGSGVYMSPAALGAAQGDAGTFTRTNTFFGAGYARIELACAPSAPQTVYALVEANFAVDKIYRTTNGGSSWTASPAMPDDDDWGIPASDFSRGQAWYDLALAVDPNNAATVLTGGVDLFKTTSSGSAWSQISHWWGGFGYPYVHADQHNIVYQSGNSNNVLFSNDGGIYLSTDGGNTFAAKNTGYNVTQFYSLAVDPRAGNPILIGGTQDNGTIMVSNTGISTSQEILGGDGSFCAINSLNPDTMYGTSQYQSISRSLNGGQNFASITNGNLNSSNTLFINPIEIDPNDPEIIYQASTSLWRMKNASWASPLQWAEATKPLTGGNITAIGISESRPNLVYAATGGVIHRISNAHNTGSGYTPLMLVPPGVGIGYISCVAVNPLDSNHIIVTYTNYGLSAHVLETREADLGQSATWRVLQGNLPDLPVNWAVFEPGNTEGVLIGTDLGVFRCADISAPISQIQWIPERKGMGYPRVDMIKVRKSDKTVHAATHGRGFFSTDSYNQQPVANFGVESLQACDGLIIFEDSSGGTPTSWNWDFGDGGTSGMQKPSHAYSASGPYTVQLIVSNGNGADTISKVINVVVIPGVNAVAGPDTTVCFGTSMQLSASGGVAYEWTPATGLDNPFSATPVASISGNTDYIVKVTGSNGCVGYDTVSLTLISNPPVWAGQDQTITRGDSIQLAASGGVSYSWSPNKWLSCTSCADPICYADSTITYTVTGTGSNGCSKTDQVQIVVIEGVGTDPLPDAFASGVEIYPNPLQGESSTLKFSIRKGGKVVIAIYDANGRKVRTVREGQYQPGEHFFRLKAGELAQGIYMIRIDSPDGTAIRKWMISGRD